MQYVASTLGFGILVFWLVLHSVAFFSAGYANYDENNIEIQVGVWGFCAEVRGFDRDCEDLLDDQPDWLETVQILMGIGSPLVLLAAILSFVQFVKGCCSGSRRQSVALTWLVMTLAGIGGIMILMSCIVYAVEYEDVVEQVLEGQLNVNLPSSKQVEDDTNLFWAFYLSIIAAIFFLIAAFLHFVDRNSTPPEVLQSGTVLTSNTNQGFIAPQPSAYPPPYQAAYPASYPPSYQQQPPYPQSKF